MRKVTFEKLYNNTDIMPVYCGKDLDGMNQSFWETAYEAYKITPWIINETSDYAKGFIFHDEKQYILYLLNN